MTTILSLLRALSQIKTLALLAVVAAYLSPTFREHCLEWLESATAVWENAR